MQIQRSVLAASMVLLSWAAPGRAEKARAWQTGKVIESGSQRSSQVTGLASGPVDGTTTVKRRQWEPISSRLTPAIA